MQSKTLATLFILLAPALAMPQATATSVASSDSSGSESSGSSDPLDTTDTTSIPSIPTDFVSVLETAVPTAWEYEMMNSASAAAVMSAAAEGIYPAWYNDLPASIKAIVTSLGGFDEVMVGETGSMTMAMSTSSSEPSSEPSSGASVATTAVSPSGSVATETQASSTLGMASSSKSTTPASASSTGGAPIATGGITMSVAGAAGLLGLALAL